MKKYLLKSVLTSFFIPAFVCIYAQAFETDPVSTVPMDPKVTYGKLDNGLTYYIRENKTPLKRAEFYLVVNSGAIQEDADQNGLAHFCEHMAFNGTRNFEKKEIINYLQSIGMKFGPEINAFTSTDETNYMLQAVPTDDPLTVDTALMVLYDWACNVAFEDEEIDNERGVIHEEWRTSRGAMFRMMKEAGKTIYQGSKYADHDVIGDIGLLDTFPYEAIKRYYHDWYRPDLQAIVAVGDFDGKEIVAKITGMFSAIPKRDEPRLKELFAVPDHDETLVSVVTDKESQYSIVQIFYKHPPDEYRNMEYYRKTIVRMLFNNMLNERLQELLLTAEPPFIYAYSGYTDLTRTKDAFRSLAMAKNNELDKALRALLTENRRLVEYGFTGTELERQKTDMVTQLEKQYAERDKQESSNYVWQYYQHFLTGEPTPGIEFDLEFVREVLPGVTLEELNQLAESWITDKNRVIVMMAPEKEGVVIPAETDVLGIVNEVYAVPVAAYVDKVSDKPLVEDIPQAGKIKKKSKDKTLGTTSWQFENGVKVVLKPTDFKEDEISMTAYSPGGTSLYDLEDLQSASQAIGIIYESGLSGFDKTELQKKLTGKIAGAYPFISGTNEGFNGSCTPRDLETMLQLVYLYFTRPRVDETAFTGYITRMKGILENKSGNPSSMLWDTAMVTMANYHPRVRPMTAELLDEVKLNRVKSIFRDRFGDPGSFTFYFVGNIDPETAKPVIEKYLGGLPTVIRNESWVDNGIRPPLGKISKTLIRNMEVPKSTVYISYTGEYDYDNYQDRINLAALCDILDIVYVETVREEQGGTYGVAVRESQDKFPDESYSVTIYFDCDPENAQKLKGIIYDEIEKIKAEGPAEKDVRAVTENFLKTHQERVRENGYWVNMLKNRDFYQTDVGNFLNYEDYVHNITIEGLKKAASQFFGSNIVEIVLMPENMDENVKNPMLNKE